MWRRGVGAALVVVAAGLGILSYGWVCPVHRLTGHPCPTCGLTRALRLALRGEPLAATRLHPLVWLAVPVVALFVVAEAVGYARTGAFGASRRLPASNALMLTTATLLFALWLARFAGFFGGPV